MVSKERWHALQALIEELRPTRLEPLAAVLTPADMGALRAMEGLGHFMRCPETGRLFVPALCARCSHA